MSTGTDFDEETSQPSQGMKTRERFFLYFMLIVLVIALVIVTALYELGPRESATTNITSIETMLKAENKNVVLSRTLTYNGRRDDAKNWWGIYIGTTTVQIRIEGCQVQYFIPTDEIRPQDFYYDSHRKSLVVFLPRPRLDTKFVDIPSDPAKWSIEKENGWFRWDKDKVEDDLRKEIRREVLATAGRTPGEDGSAVLEKSLREKFAKWFSISPDDVKIVYRD